MPAIILRDLEIQIQKMAKLMGSPSLFYIALRDIYEYYTNRTFRPSQEFSNPILIPTYRLLPQIQRSILFYLLPQIQKSPAQAFQLSKELWEKTHFEHKEIAISILGNIPFQKQLNILDILSRWASETDEELLQKKIATEGISSLINQNPTELLSWIKENLFLEGSKNINFSYLCLHSFIKTNPTKHLPDILLILREVLSPPSHKYQHHYFDIFKLLSNLIPRETTYFLLEIKSKFPDNKIISRLNKTQSPA